MSLDFCVYAFAAALIAASVLLSVHPQRNVRRDIWAMGMVLAGIAIAIVWTLVELGRHL